MKKLTDIQKEARICTLSSYHQFLDEKLQEAYNLGQYEANLKGAIARCKPLLENTSTTSSLT